VNLVSPDDVRFHYEGRIDFADPAAPGLIWAGTRVGLEFEGSMLALRFADATGQNFFNATVDGAHVIVGVPEGGASRIEVPVPAGPGRHRFELFKRSEADAGWVRFGGVELAAGAEAWAPVWSERRVRLEFFGDSIMAGACNEDGAVDQWDDRRTHNHALSYTTLTAEALRAECRCLAVSGMGIAAGFVEVKAGQVWDRLYPRADAPRADLRAWQPDVALFNFGENDASFTREQGQPFPAGYTAGYVALVRAVRDAYPRAHLVLLRGGMGSGATCEPLRVAWEEVVRQVEAADAAVSHFVFKHWSVTHPRVSDDRAMADELVAWLRRQPFMRPAGPGQ